MKILDFISNPTLTPDPLPTEWDSQQLIRVLIFWGRLLRIKIPEEFSIAAAQHHAGPDTEKGRAVYPLVDGDLPEWIQLLHVVDALSARVDPRTYNNTHKRDSIQSAISKILAEESLSPEVKCWVCKAYHLHSGNPKESLS